MFYYTQPWLEVSHLLWTEKFLRKKIWHYWGGGARIHHQQLKKIPALSLFSSLLCNVSASMLNELMTMEHW